MKQQSLIISTIYIHPALYPLYSSMEQARMRDRVAMMDSKDENLKKLLADNWEQTQARLEKDSYKILADEEAFEKKLAAMRESRRPINKAKRFLKALGIGSVTNHRANTAVVERKPKATPTRDKEQETTK